MAQATARRAPGGRTLAAVGGVVFLVTAAAAAPASLVPAVLSAAGLSVSHGGASGLWRRGEIRDLRVEGLDLGDVSFDLRALALLAGRADADLTARGGALTGRGRLSAGIFGRRVRLSDVDAVFDLDAIRDYTLFGIPYSGSARLTADRLEAGPKGCVEAQGRFWTDALSGAARGVLEGPVELAGPVRCEGANLAIDLTGESVDGAAVVSLVVQPDLRYRVAASVRPQGDDMRRNLEMLGFESRDGAFVFDAVGALKGVGS